MHPRRLAWRALSAAIAAVSALSLVLLVTHPAGALTVTETPTPVTGTTTYFDGLGQPYGGCGLAQANLESQNFVALNVYDTPRDYGFYPRPLTGANLSKLGMWNNGHNCGRWIQVTVSDFCTGVNDGAQNQAFCRNGASSATEPTVGDLYPNHFNNRRMTWQFVPAPNYSGDIQVGFLKGAQVWWPAISVSHLANGVHSVDYLANGVWQPAQRNGDMGQSFILGGTVAGANQFQIRLRHVTDTLINNGRVYSFTLPSSCGSSCPTGYTQVAYTTSTSTPTPSSTPTASPSPSVTATPVPTPTSTPSSAAKACAATYSVTGQWSGGFQAEVAVRNAGATALSAWRSRGRTPMARPSANCGTAP